MKTALFLLTSSIGLLSTACDKCSDVDPPSNALSFFLVSLTGQNLIGRSSPQYHPDSLRITFQGRPFDFSVPGEPLSGGGNVVTLNPAGIFDGKSDARLFIRLNSTDTDTIDITYSIEKGKCSDIFQYNSVFYNGRRMGQDGNGFYRLIKQ
jgi:hypothetical protein